MKSGLRELRVLRGGENGLYSGFERVTSDIATALYYTGIDPFTGEEVYVAKGLRDRKMQRALMQFFKPENYFMNTSDSGAESTIILLS